VGHDRVRPSIFDRIQPGEEGNLPLLLDVVYGDMMQRVSILETQVKGRLSVHESELLRVDGRLKRMENCPCSVHRDPAHTCVILDVRDSLAKIEAQSAEKLAEIERRNAEEFARINNRLAYWGGGLAVILILIEVLSRLLPVFWR
jgi:hypothetical protein